MMRWLLSVFVALMLTGCGFHLQTEMQVAKPLQRLYLQTSDPYGDLTRYLANNLKLSHVQLTLSAAEAETILAILQDTTSQSLLSVSGTQQTRQYRLRTTVAFEINDNKGRTLVPSQTLSESKVITVQSNQILGSSNEANVYYQQMRRELAHAILTRIASPNVAAQVTEALAAKKHRKKS
jgi:LPS-assembly lipoprotein